MPSCTGGEVRTGGQRSRTCTYQNLRCGAGEHSLLCLRGLSSVKTTANLCRTSPQVSQKTICHIRTIQVCHFFLLSPPPVGTLVACFTGGQHHDTTMEARSLESTWVSWGYADVERVGPFGDIGQQHQEGWHGEMLAVEVEVKGPGGHVIKQNLEGCLDFGFVGVRAERCLDQEISFGCRGERWALDRTRKRNRKLVQ